MADSISTRVVMAVAEQKGVEHTDLPPLYSVIDSEALDALFERRLSRDEHPACEIQFSYAGEEVHVRNGHITVSQARQQAGKLTDG